jgi:osmotically-inducible protein OsmY
VSRADLVRAFHRADEEIEREIREDVLRRMLWITSDRLRVTVHEGMVMLRGQVESEADAEVVRDYAQRVPGVLDVDAELRWPASDRSGRGFIRW